MPVADLTMNMIEFFNDASNSEGRQIPQSTASIRKATEKVMNYRDGQEVFPVLQKKGIRCPAGCDKTAVSRGICAGRAHSILHNPSPAARHGETGAILLPVH
jgi:hypothetical protein